MKKWLPLSVICSLFSLLAHSQSVVISAYFNAADPRDEWTELLVITDNTDMRSWTIRDNNSTQTSWQTAATFTTNALWNNLRAGTIIMIWHRPVTSNGSTLHPTDVNKNDGYIEVDLSNSTYFTGAALGSSPSWGGASMNVAGGGEIVQLRNASGTHIHGVGHMSSPGSDWTAMASPKLNHANSASSGDAIYVCPGNSVAEYGTSTPQSGTTWTSKNSTTITFGLPNVSGSSPTQNEAYWLSLRQPPFTSQTVAASAVVPGNPGSISFSWTGATDPNPADGTVGYIILRNTTNSFTAPTDGTTYTNGATLGTATVLTHITASGTTNYTDNTVMNGNAYYYRVYAYRYTTDNQNGNSFDESRGRAYTSTFVSVSVTDPLPVTWTSFTAEQYTGYVQLNWETASEKDNNYFSVERCGEDGIFSTIGTVDGHGTTSQPNQYLFTDNAPANGVSYYRLRQVDYNGQFSFSVIRTVIINSNTTVLHAYVAESGVNWTIAGEVKEHAVLELWSVNGQLIERIDVTDKQSGTLPLPSGNAMYFLRLVNGEEVIMKTLMAR